MVAGACSGPARRRQIPIPADKPGYPTHRATSEGTRQGQEILDQRRSEIWNDVLP
jgi:hypothetical protein